MSSSDESTLKKLKQLRDQVTIKPADKNLGLVLMNTDHYITQCTSQLADTNTHRLANHYPREDVKKTTEKCTYQLQTSDPPVQQEIIRIPIIRTGTLSYTAIKSSAKYHQFDQLFPSVAHHSAPQLNLSTMSCNP